VLLLAVLFGEVGGERDPRQLFSSTPEAGRRPLAVRRGGDVLPIHAEMRLRPGDVVIALELSEASLTKPAERSDPEARITGGNP
jgi:hypothetical protein